MFGRKKNRSDKEVVVLQDDIGVKATETLLVGLFIDLTYVLLNY